MVNPYNNTLLLTRRNQIMIYATILVNPPKRLQKPKHKSICFMFYYCVYEKNHRSEGVLELGCGDGCIKVTLFSVFEISQVLEF